MACASHPFHLKHNFFLPCFDLLNLASDKDQNSSPGARPIKNVEGILSIAVDVSTSKLEPRKSWFKFCDDFLNVITSQDCVFAWIAPDSRSVCTFSSQHLTPLTISRSLFICVGLFGFILSKSRLGNIHPKPVRFHRGCQEMRKVCDSRLPQSPDSRLVLKTNENDKDT